MVRNKFVKNALFILKWLFYIAIIAAIVCAVGIGAALYSNSQN